MKHSVRVLLVAENGGWTAIGLELWTTAQADTIRQAVNAFMQTLAADLIAHDDPRVEPIPRRPGQSRGAVREGGRRDRGAEHPEHDGDGAGEHAAKPRSRDRAVQDRLKGASPRTPILARASAWAYTRAASHGPLIGQRGEQ